MSDRYKVIGAMPVAGTNPGDTVELDPDKVNIPALLAAGLIELVKQPASKSADDTPKSSGRSKVKGDDDQ